MAQRKFLTIVNAVPTGHASTDDITLNSAIFTTALVETSGGTGESTYTTGDILYSDASNSLAKRAIGTTGQVLTVSGGVPVWTDSAGDITAVTAGAGLTGGGTSGAVTLDVGAGDGISVAADSVAVDSTVLRTTGSQSITSGTKTFATGTTASFSSGATFTIASGATATVADAPTADTHIANKAYVDAVATGLDVKKSVRVATTAALPAYTAAGSGVGKTLTANAVGVLTVDGVATVLNNRILVKDQAASHADHGLYKVTTEGTAGVAFVLTRAIDADTSTEMNAGMFTFIEEGTANADSGWVLSTNETIIVDTTALAFSQFSGAGSISAGAGLTKTGNTIDVVSANTGIVVNADDITLTLNATSGLEIVSGLRIADSVAGAGLTITSKILAVGAGDGISVAADSVAVDSTVLRTTGSQTITSGIKTFATGTTLDIDSGATFDLNTGSTFSLKGSTAGSTVTGANLTTLTDGSYADSLHKMKTLHETYTAGTGGITINKAVYISANDTVLHADSAALSTSRCMGVAIETITATNPVKVAQFGALTGSLTAATAGSPVYVGTAGALTQTAPTASGSVVFQVGMAKNATDLEIQPMFMYVNA